MTRRFLHFPLLASAMLLLALFACQKDQKPTIVNGRVVNKYTGAPVDSANVILSFTKKTTPYIIEYREVRSTLDGTFNFFILPDNIKWTGIYEVYRKGYLITSKEHPTITVGETNDITLNLIPNDGVLNIILNNTGPSDSIYVAVYSPLQDYEYGLSHGIVKLNKLFLEGMSSQNIVFNIASNQTVFVYWDFTPLTTPTIIQQAQNYEPVYISQQDTTVFNINF